MPTSSGRLAARTVPPRSITVMLWKSPVVMICCTETSTETQSSSSVAAEFCVAMKRASAAPLSINWFIIAAFWRCVMIAAVSPITTATISAIVAAHFTRSGMMRAPLFVRSFASISASERPSASESSSPVWKRRSGALARQRSTMRRSEAGRSGRSFSIGIGSSFAIFTASATRLSPRKGRCPVSI